MASIRRNSGAIAVDEIRGGAPGHDVVVGRLVADVEQGLAEPTLGAQVPDEGRQELGQELLAWHGGSLPIGLHHREIGEHNLAARPTAFAELGNKTRFEQIHATGVPEHLGQLVEAGTIKLQFAIRRSAAPDQFQAHPEDVLPVLGHVLGIALKQTIEALVVGRSQLVVLGEFRS